MQTSILHSAFKLNGLPIKDVNHLIHVAQTLKADGTAFEQGVATFLLKWCDLTACIEVNTSGSTGNAKNIQLQKHHMVNSALATGAFFEMGQGKTALLCLSANYIAGKMMLVRALTLGWDLYLVAPEIDAISQIEKKYDFAAMVPYQVHQSLDSLDKIKKLIIGGGEVSTTLEALLQQKETQIFATYGMTETITHVAVRRINGADNKKHFNALPFVQFSKDKRGCLVINAPHISEGIVITNDLVELLSSTSFIWVGRFDNVINTGGIKVSPEKIEKILAAEIDIPFIISSEKNEALGEQVVLVLETDHTINTERYSDIFQKLSPYERPKQTYTLSKFPLTENGKIRRSKIKNLLASKHT